MPTIGVLPLDDRPVCYDFPSRIGAIGGAEVRLPPREHLGNLKKPADRKALARWLLETAPELDALVLAVDTLAYGGLVPSRRSPDDLATLLAHLEVLKALKAAHPRLPLYAFSVTMRLSDSNVNEEEKPYWDLYGKLIYRWSFHEHRYKVLSEPADRLIAREARSGIPPEILEDYLETRERNFALNQVLIKWAGADFFDALLLTQDDTSAFGLNVQEREQLQAMVDSSKIGDRVLIYPGADEVASVLVARALNRLQGQAPSFAASWHPLDGKRIQAMYEDRPLWKTLRGQIQAVGGREISSESDADLILVINAPASGQGDLALRLNLDWPDTPSRSLEPLLLTLESPLKPVALADVAYANGADPRLMPELVKRIDPWSLKGFAAWNTAGNTFGTLVATAACATLPSADPAALQRFITERLADDWLYQSIIRPELQASQKEGTALPALKAQLDSRLAGLWASHFPDHPATFKTYFPWERLFEAAIVAN